MKSAPSLSFFAASASLLAALVAGCSNKPKPDPPPTASVSLSTAEATSSAAEDSPPAAEAGTPLFVQDKLVDCEGEGPMKCMLVRTSPDKDWELFYDAIEGFTFEPGYTYELRIEKSTVDDPPADGSSLSYRLVKVVSKDAVAPSTP